MKRLSKTIGVKNYSKRKQHYANGCIMTIDSMADQEKKLLEDELNIILKSANYNPEQLLEYIKKHDTNVYRIENSTSLTSIGENEGFIYPQKGFKALYLSFLTSRKFKFNSKEMFVISKGEINKYMFIYHFYNWYAFMHNIEGMDIESQNLLKKYLFNNTDSSLKQLQLDDIYKLKEAIKQDKSAIEFVFNLCRQMDGAKKALDKLKNEGTSI